MTQTGPSHLLLEPGDVFTACGIDTRRNLRAAFLLAKYLPRYQRAWRERGVVGEYPVCEECYHVAFQSTAT